MILNLVSRVFRAFVVLLLGAGLLWHAIAQFELSTRLLSPRLAPITTALTITILVAVAISLFLPLGKRRSSWGMKLTVCLAILAFLLITPFTFMITNFGMVDLETVLISVSQNAPRDLWDVAIKDFSGALIEHIVVGVLIILTAWYLLRRMPGATIALFVITVAFIAGSQPARYVYSKVFPNPALALITLDDFQPPVITAAPDRQRNLVVIHLESLERSYRDIVSSADAFATLARFEDEGFSASNLAQIRGTHYSAAGLVATHCGIPLYPRGIVDPRTISSSEELALLGMDSFMPGVTCLGDILSERGYENSYVNGSDADIFAIADFLRSHGFDTVRGLKTEPEFENVGGSNTWGVPDTVLFDVAEQELDRFVASGTPFFMNIFTASTHGPAGYLDPGCEYSPPIPPSQADSLMPATIHCTGKLILQFLQDLEDRGLAEDTVVAVMSDHLAMPNTMIGELRGVGDDRRNYFALINGPSDSLGLTTDRASTMMDVYPTLLEALGFGLKDGKGNLGRSLLGEDPTLAQSIGLDALGHAAFGNQAIGELVWQAPE